MLSPDELWPGQAVVRRPQVAEVLGISLSTVTNWERLGLIPSPRAIGPNLVGWFADDARRLIEDLPTRTAEYRATHGTGKRRGRPAGKPA